MFTSQMLANSLLAASSTAATTGSSSSSTTHTTTPLLGHSIQSTRQLERQIQDYLSSHDKTKPFSDHEKSGRHKNNKSPNKRKRAMYSTLSSSSSNTEKQQRNRHTRHHYHHHHESNTLLPKHAFQPYMSLRFFTCDFIEQQQQQQQQFTFPNRLHALRSLRNEHTVAGNLPIVPPQQPSPRQRHDMGVRTRAAAAAAAASSATSSATALTIDISESMNCTDDHTDEVDYEMAKEDDDETNEIHPQDEFVSHVIHPSRFNHHKIRELIHYGLAYGRPSVVLELLARIAFFRRERRISMEQTLSYMTKRTTSASNADGDISTSVSTSNNNISTETDIDSSSKTNPTVAAVVNNDTNRENNQCLQTALLKEILSQVYDTQTEQLMELWAWLFCVDDRPRMNCEQQQQQVEQQQARHILVQAICESFQSSLFRMFRNRPLLFIKAVANEKDMNTQWTLLKLAESIDSEIVLLRQSECDVFLFECIANQHIEDDMLAETIMSLVLRHLHMVGSTFSAYFQGIENEKHLNVVEALLYHHRFETFHLYKEDLKCVFSQQQQQQQQQPGISCAFTLVTLMLDQVEPFHSPMLSTITQEWQTHIVPWLFPLIFAAATEQDNTTNNHNNTTRNQENEEENAMPADTVEETTRMRQTRSQSSQSRLPINNTSSSSSSSSSSLSPFGTRNVMVTRARWSQFSERTTWDILAWSIFIECMAARHDPVQLWHLVLVFGIQRFWAAVVLLVQYITADHTTIHNNHNNYSTAESESESESQSETATAATTSSFSYRTIPWIGRWIMYSTDMHQFLSMVAQDDSDSTVVALLSHTDTRMTWKPLFNRITIQRLLVEKNAFHCMKYLLIHHHLPLLDCVAVCSHIVSRDMFFLLTQYATPRVRRRYLQFQNYTFYEDENNHTNSRTNHADDDDDDDDDDDESNENVTDTDTDSDDANDDELFMHPFDDEISVDSDDDDDDDDDDEINGHRTTTTTTTQERDDHGFPLEKEKELTISDIFHLIQKTLLKTQQLFPHRPVSLEHKTRVLDSSLLHSFDYVSQDHVSLKTFIETNQHSSTSSTSCPNHLIIVFEMSSGFSSFSSSSSSTTTFSTTISGTTTATTNPTATTTTTTFTMSSSPLLTFMTCSNVQQFVNIHNVFYEMNYKKAIIPDRIFVRVTLSNGIIVAVPIADFLPFFTAAAATTTTTTTITTTKPKTMVKHSANTSSTSQNNNNDNNNVRLFEICPTAKRCHFLISYSVYHNVGGSDFLVGGSRGQNDVNMLIHRIVPVPT